MQTLVTVRLVGGTAAYQNLFVYDNIMAVKPLLLFSLFRLVQGDAKISNHNTIITSEVDPASSVNTGRPNADLVPDLYREFEWFDRENTFIQVSFPGFFPDLTRFQAETDQAKADRGQDPWKRDAKITAQHLAAKFFAWDANAPATLESGGGAHDIQAVVSVKNTGASGGTIKVRLSRLTGNANGGIWEVTAVESKGIAINSPESRRLLSNPVDVDVTVDSTLKGPKNALIILDHLFEVIGGAYVSDLFSASRPQIHFFSSLDGMGGSPRYPYAEEGVMMLLIGDANGKIIAATMQKELLGS